ncbi:MAG: hypothetical protein IPP48_02950 [Chitinophagaceae bacterium]|nr:hypothetical protein [Chitinophagaceae bacterium]
MATSTVYLRFEIANNKSTFDTIVFFPGNTIYGIKLFSKDSVSEKLIVYPTTGSPDGFLNFAMPPNAKKLFYAKLNFSKTETNTLNPSLITPSYEDSFKKGLYNRRSDIKTFGFVLSGLLLMMIFFTATNYYLSQKREFLYYCFYSISVFLIVFFHAYLYKRSGVLSSIFNGYGDFFLLLSGTIFYIAFIRRFLDTATKYKVLNKVLRIEERFVFGMLLFYTYLHFFTNNIKLEISIEDFMKIIILAFGVVYIVLAFKQKEKLLNYLAIGNSLSIIFWGVSLGLILANVSQTNIFNSALVYYEVGLAMALISFLLGLTYKNRVELIEKIKEQEALKLEAEKQKHENEITVYKAQQEERNRISADMHDDLGAGMTSIRLYSELAKAKLSGKDLPEIEKISSSADELLSKMNAIIWSMASSNDTLENMIAYLRSYAIEYFENTGVKCIINLPEQIPHAIVNGFIRRNVFLVVKEALNNVLKHANATEVKLTLTAESKTLQLFIHDNGKGIDFSNLRQFSNGLKNMKKRMDDVEIDFKIENDNGTLITLTRDIKD